MADDYSVGYRRPPKHGRFKPGQSGNPYGRPRGVVNSKTLLARALREKVVINVNGKQRSMTKQEVIYRQLVNKAASGELRPILEIIELDRSAESKPDQQANMSGDELIAEIKRFFGMMEP